MWTRRDLLSMGSLSVLGLTLPQLLGAQPRKASKDRTSARTHPPARSCILLFLEGGPSHIDLWDLKPRASTDIRGLYQPISTSVPGLQISERLPDWAPIMKHLAMIRSVTHNVVDHNASSYFTVTGHDPIRGGELVRRPSRDNFPPIGAVLSKLRPTNQPLPDFVHIPRRMFNCGSYIPGQLAGFFGHAFDPFITGDPSDSDFKVPGLEPLPELSSSRLAQRRQLLSEIRERTLLDNHQAVGRIESYYDEAYALVTSATARKAFRLAEEPTRIRARYGCEAGQRGTGKLAHLGASLLLARRLVEAGIRLVTVWAGRQAFDTHRQHYKTLDQEILPYLNRAFAALMTDLADRDLLDETLVAVLGEFGRTPKLGQVTSSAGATPEGRDHWPRCYTALLGGAGIQAGAVYGASDQIAAYPARDPVSPKDIVATIYMALGVDPKIRIRDALNRPHTLVDGDPIAAVMA